jgi:hypothetical protein
MDLVLDLDLDFFVSPIAHWPDNGRLPERDFRHATADEIGRFLERCCHLDRYAPIRGRQFVNHQDSFKTWRQWIVDGKLTIPFEVVHVDAHADLGLGSGGWVYLVSELLSRRAADRRGPKLGKSALNSGNYLLFAIANRWISRLTYVYPSARGENPANGAPDDLWAELFRHRDPTSGKVELKRYSTEDAKKVLGGANVQALSVEPSVPFSFVRAAGFTMMGFTHMVVAQSPRFTPKSADQLLPVIQEYFEAG